MAEKDNLTSSDLAEVGLPSYHPPTLLATGTHLVHPRERIFNASNSKPENRSEVFQKARESWKITPNIILVPSVLQRYPALFWSSATAPVAKPGWPRWLVRLQMMERHEAQILSQGADEINTESQMCGVSAVGTIPSLKGPDVRKVEVAVNAICAWGSKFPLFAYNREWYGNGHQPNSRGLQTLQTHYNDFL